MDHSLMAALRRSIVGFVAGALFLVPAFAFAQVYGGGNYGGGNYNVGAVEVSTGTVSSGGGQVVGSSPTAPGYVNTAPIGSTTASTNAISSNASLTEMQIGAIISLLQSFGADQSVIDNISASLRGGSASAGSSGVFTRDLQSGDMGDDVKALQIYLNTHGFILTDTGPGSPGQETVKFGAFTRIALGKFQAANGITPAVGYFGPKTRAFIER